MVVETIASGLWQIACRTRDRPNAFVVDDGDLTLIDSGWPEDAETISEGIAKAGFDPADIDRILVTHYDADHVGALAPLTPDLDAPLCVHEMDAPYVAGERLPPWTARKGVEAFHRWYYARLELPDLPVRRIRDGDELGGFRAHHTPGHTAYVHDDLGAVFLGDLAWERGGRLRSSGFFTSYDRNQVQRSTRRLLARMPDIEYVCPGHGRTLVDPAVADGQ